MRLIFFKTLFLFLFSVSVYAQFEQVTVKLQSGSEIQLTELPWFKFAINISYGQYKNQATSADWIIAAPPQFCPFGNSYRVQWAGQINSFKQQTIDDCTNRTRQKLQGLPPEVSKICECKIVLESQKKIPNEKIIWNSLDDSILMSDELKIRRTLVSSKGELPIIFSVGGTNSGLYDFNGNKLCTYNGKKSAEASQDTSALARVERMFKVSDKPLPILCFDNLPAEMDISKISYSTFSSKVVGDIYLKFQNGENYVIKPD